MPAYTPALDECTEAARRWAAAVHEIVAAARDVAGACGRGMDRADCDDLAILTIDTIRDAMWSHTYGEDHPGAEFTGLMAARFYGLKLNDKQQTDLAAAEAAILRMEAEQIGSAA